MIFFFAFSRISTSKHSGWPMPFLDMRGDRNVILSQMLWFHVICDWQSHMRLTISYDIFNTLLILPKSRKIMYFLVQMKMTFDWIYLTKNPHSRRWHVLHHDMTVEIPKIAYFGSVFLHKIAAMECNSMSLISHVIM